MSLAKRALAAAAETAMSVAMDLISNPPPPGETIVWKSKGSPYGTSQGYGVLNRQTRRRIAKRETTRAERLDAREERPQAKREREWHLRRWVALQKKMAENA